MSDLSTLPPPTQEIAEQRTPLPPVPSILISNFSVKSFASRLR